MWSLQSLAMARRASRGAKIRSKASTAVALDASCSSNAEPITHNKQFSFFSLSFFFQGSVEFQTQTASEAPFARHCRRALDKFEKKVFELLSLCCHLARLCIAIVNRHPAPVLPTHQPRNESASRTPLLFLQCLDQTPTLCITPPPGTKHQSKIHSDDGIEPTAGYSPYGLTLGG